MLLTLWLKWNVTIFGCVVGLYTVRFMIILVLAITVKIRGTIVVKTKVSHYQIREGVINTQSLQINLMIK